MNTLEFQVLKKGGLVKQAPQPFMQANYYPAKVRVKGKGYSKLVFGEEQDHDFDSTFEIQVRKGDYGEWQADFDDFDS